ncbi:MAG: GNAT family N-acetyltransferase [Candidatus Bathyarchaeales archaeon]
MESVKGLSVQLIVMKAGQIIKTFNANDGRRVILRVPKWEDAGDLLGLINSLVEEGADILRTEKVSREEEIDWLSKALASIEKGEAFYLVAEVDGKVVASSDIHPRGGLARHVGVLGIIVMDGFRDVGIGTEMMNALIEKAREMGLKVLTLSVFASNKRAIHVYEKVGFAVTGRVPKKFFKNGEYIDELIMAKVLE